MTPQLAPRIRSHLWRDSGSALAATLVGLVIASLVSAAPRAGPAYVTPFPGHVPAYASIALDSRDQRVWIYGGIASGVGRLGDLWSFDLETLRWEKAEWTGGSPPRLAAAGMAYDSDGHRLLVYGGSQRPAYIGDWFCNEQLWEFDLETHQWAIALPAPENFGKDRMPIVRDPNDGSIWAFFGTCDDARPTRLYTHLDLRLQARSHMISPSNGPDHRMNHVATYHPESKQILLFGGGTQSDGCLGLEDCRRRFRNLSIVWALDPPTNTWTPLTDGEGRPPQKEAIGDFDSISDLMLIRGGIVGDLSIAMVPYLSDEVWAFDASRREWLILAPQGNLATRRNAAGVYCPCRGELLIIGGYTTFGFDFPRPEEAALLVPIERPAEFAWDGAAASEVRRSVERWGTLRFPVGSEEVEGFEEGSVRLVNCETEGTLHTASAVRRVGRDAWHLRFDELGPQAEEAQAKGRLIVTGRPIGAPVNFHARLPKTGVAQGSRGRRESVQPTAGVTTEERTPELRAQRVAGGWEIHWARAAAAPLDLRIYDVAGRLRFRQGAALTGAAPYFWDGKDNGGNRLPKGLYFVRVISAEATATAKLFLW